jgi:CheY-like chemotaxis protein
MALLLEVLLDVSRITRSSLELRRQPTLLAKLIESAIETARPLIDRKKHILKVDLPSEAMLLDVDPLRISQVISNLLNNAAKYTNPGGSIALSAELRGEGIVLTVEDNGIGIPKEDLGAIFRMFAQLKSAQERSEGGLGIGLSLTKGLVDLHGGTIEAASDGLGTGSRFTVTLPNACVRADAADAKEAFSNAPVLCRRILLADDNVDAADSLALLLRSDGHEVAVARDGVEAIRVFRQFGPDVALLDIGMPHRSGYDVAREIRDGNPTVLLIAITGWGQGSDREQSAEAGFDHHLTKPVDYRDLTKYLNCDCRDGTGFSANG